MIRRRKRERSQLNFNCRLVTPLFQCGQVKWLVKNLTVLRKQLIWVKRHNTWWQPIPCQQKRRPSGREALVKIKLQLKFRHLPQVGYFSQHSLSYGFYSGKAQDFNHFYGCIWSCKILQNSKNRLNFPALKHRDLFIRYPFNEFLKFKFWNQLRKKI